jgi:threonine/homoserine/homoserine lactone efflux protein
MSSCSLSLAPSGGKMLTLLTTGLILGLSAGLAPGPLMAFVIGQSLRYSWREGVWAALSPLVTDLPIIAVTLLALAHSPHRRMVLGAISLAGGLFVLYLAYETWRARPAAIGPPNGQSRSLTKGIIVNFLSPHPYLFWLTVGGPILLRTWAENPATSALFAAGFYLPLIGSKIAIAIAAGRSRGFLEGTAYLYIMRVLAILLAGMAVMIAVTGIRILRTGG